MLSRDWRLRVQDILAAIAGIHRRTAVIKFEDFQRDETIAKNDILDQYADSQLDFVDATIIAIAERENITRVLTLDRRDLTLVRPQHCDYFELLL